MKKAQGTSRRRAAGRLLLLLSGLLGARAVAALVQQNTDTPPAQNKGTITTGQSRDAKKSPGAEGDVAGQVPAQHEQAMQAPVKEGASSTYGPGYSGDGFWVTGQRGVLPADNSFRDPSGQLGLVNTAGAIDTAGHPFFTPLGSNGRACVTCHQPKDGMSISVKTLGERWAATHGRDPVFAPVDGMNCPTGNPASRAAHSLLLQHGLFRIFLPWPPKAADGSSLRPEFSITVVHDPTGCNTSAKYGLHSTNPMISVYRRPRVVANLKYAMAPFGLWSPKTGEVLPVDPETGRRLNLNLLADNRQPTLEAQAVDAAFNHEQAAKKPGRETLAAIVAFESQVYSAQAQDARGGDLARGDIHAGPQALIDGKVAVLGSHVGDFPELNGWKTSTALAGQHWDRNTPKGIFPEHRPGQDKETPEQTKFRDSVARGYELYMERDILIKDVSNYNTIGLGNPYKQPCANCHNMQRTGMDSSPGFMDLGTTNVPTADPQPWLPLFKVTCRADVTPHPFLGRVILTHDPGRALITGKCVDVGSINMQQFRGLAARAPYFSNGSAKTLRDVVVYYNKRFNMGYSQQDMDDMANFLSVL